MNSSNAFLYKVTLRYPGIPVGSLVSHRGIPIGHVIEYTPAGEAIIDTLKTANSQAGLGQAYSSGHFTLLNDRPELGKSNVEFSDPFLKKLDHARQKYSASYRPTPSPVVKNFVLSG